MLLKSLRLENIRSYTDDMINFSEGSSLLLGDIGAGKTTVLLGIEFALFGLIKGDVSGTTLLRHGKALGSVELCFRLEGKDITIARRLKRKNGIVMQDSGFIILDGKKIEATPIELKSRILELFGYPQDLINKNTSLIYRYTVYTPQEDMKTILFESKEERLDTLRKIFNIDKYKRVRENALNYAKELRNMKKILESKIMDLEQRKSELEDRKRSGENISKDLASIQEQYSAFKKSFDEKDSELRDFENRLIELNSLKKDLAVAEVNLKGRKSELERTNKDSGIIDYRIREYENKLRDLGVIDNDEDQLKQLIKVSEENLSKINNAKAAVKERLENKEDDLKNMIVEDQASLDSRRSMITKRLEEKIIKQESLDKMIIEHDKDTLEMHALRISVGSSEKIIKQLKDLNTCPICLQVVDFSHKVKISDKELASINSLNRRLAEIENKDSDSRTFIDKTKKELEQLRQDEMELREINMRLENIASKTETRKQLIKDIEELKIKKDRLDKMDVNRLVDTISRNRKILSNIEIRKHITESLDEKKSQRIELENRSTALIEEIKALAGSLDAIADNVKKFLDIEKVYNEKKQALESTRQTLKELEIKASSIQKDLEIAENDIMRLNAEIKLKMQIKSRINYLGEMNHWITEHFISLTSIIEKTIMQKVHNEFDELFRKWFDIMMEDEGLDVRIDEEFTPVIIQNSYETDITNLSGGEKTSVALAYRLALNKVINDFISTIKTRDIIILDEPTDGFSTEQLDKMREVLEELRIGQMIIVSHEAKMESYVQNIIRIAKNEHNSKVLI